MYIRTDFPFLFFNQIYTNMGDTLSIIHNFVWVYKPLSKRAKISLLIALILIIISSLIASLIPRMIGVVIDDVIIDQQAAYSAVMIICGLFLFDIIIEVIRKYMIENTATQTQKDLIVRTSDRLIRLDIQWLNSQRSGGLNGRVQRSVEGAVSLMKLITMDFLPNIFQMIFAVGVAFFTNIYVGIILLLVIVIGLFIVNRQIHSQKGIRLSLLRAREDNDSNIVELLTGIESVRVANEESKQMQRIENVNENLRQTELKHHIKMMFFDGMKRINIVVWNIAILILGIVLASRKVITPGDVVTFNLLFNNILVPLQNIHRFLDEAHEASLKTSDLHEILDLPIDSSYIITTDNRLAKADQYAIDIRNLYFSYEDRNILKDVNFDFKKGQYYGIIGPTGCGKSTLLRVIMNLVHFDKGNLYIFGRDIHTISREELSSQIVFMPQTPYIFRGTIKENLLFSCKKDHDDAELWWALEQACLAEDIKSMDDQLDFMLNERGSNISGGQRQRVALARVFLNILNLENDHIVILDEATSALDIVTEEVIIDNILTTVNEKTTIIAIAHRYTTLKNTNEIIHMEDGRIKEIINYHNLMEMVDLEMNH